ncbi:hypothetical protein Q5752_000648 [Cryptotrichosporon argae]
MPRPVTRARLARSLEPATDDVSHGQLRFDPEFAALWSAVVLQLADSMCFRFPLARLAAQSAFFADIASLLAHDGPAPVHSLPSASSTALRTVLALHDGRQDVTRFPPRMHSFGISDNDVTDVLKVIDAYDPPRASRLLVDAYEDVVEREALGVCALAVPTGNARMETMTTDVLCPARLPKCKQTWTRRLIPPAKWQELADAQARRWRYCRNLFEMLHGCQINTCSNIGYCKRQGHPGAEAGATVATAAG